MLVDQTLKMHNISAVFDMLHPACIRSARLISQVRCVSLKCNINMQTTRSIYYDLNTAQWHPYNLRTARVFYLALCECSPAARHPHSPRPGHLRDNRLLPRSSRHLCKCLILPQTVPVILIIVFSLMMSLLPRSLFHDLKSESALLATLHILIHTRGICFGRIGMVFIKVQTGVRIINLTL